MRLAKGASYLSFSRLTRLHFFGASLLDELADSCCLFAWARRPGGVRWLLRERRGGEVRLSGVAHLVARAWMYLGHVRLSGQQPGRPHPPGWVAAPPFELGRQAAVEDDDPFSDQLSKRRHGAQSRARLHAIPAGIMTSR